MIGPDLQLLENGREFAELRDLLEGELSRSEDILILQLIENREIDRVALKQISRFRPNCLRALGRLDTGTLCLFRWIVGEWGLFHGQVSGANRTKINRLPEVPPAPVDQ